LFSQIFFGSVVKFGTRITTNESACLAGCPLLPIPVLITSLNDPTPGDATLAGGGIGFGLGLLTALLIMLALAASCGTEFVVDTEVVNADVGFAAPKVVLGVRHGANLGIESCIKLLAASTESS
jgi:hypothetical protein